jgi:hypothetical protein
MFRHPVFGAMTYVAMVFIDPPSRWWGGALPSVRWSLVSALVTVIGLFLLRPPKHDIPLQRHGPFVALIVVLVYAAFQTPWARDLEEHRNFLEYYLKYAVAVFLLYYSIDSLEHFKWMLWTYVAGCVYLAYVAFTSFTGGRFDSFGGAGIGDANAGALTLVTGTFIASSLFLYSGKYQRVLLFFLIPFMLNSVIMTVSRSGSLALAMGGLAFIVFTPVRYKKKVMALAVLGVIGVISLTNPEYWTRMQTVKYKGADVAGVDTGGARRNLLRVQGIIFLRHPLGCGHRCTDLLAVSYLDQKDLNEQSGKRSSHNTFMSMLVDFGIVGASVYLFFLWWVYRQLSRMKKRALELPQLLQMLLPGITGAYAALTVSDQFIPNVRYELRYWLLTFLMLMVVFAAKSRSAPTDGAARGSAV